LSEKRADNLVHLNPTNIQVFPSLFEYTPVAGKT